MDNKQHSQDFTDDSIRRFLLGQLKTEEQTLFEEHLFTNSDLEARVRLAEFELADDCAFKRLTESEIESFREKYLLTADRNHRLEVSKAIRARFVSESVSETSPTVFQRLMPLFNLRRPAWRYAFAALGLILILATVFLVTKEPQVVNRFIPERFRSTPHASPTPQLMNHSNGSSSPAHSEQAPPAASHESPLIVGLTSTSSQEQSPVITPPLDANAVVRFQLSIKEDAKGVYRADLLAASGETLFSVESLKPYGPKASTIDFDVPAKDLKSGQYQIRLSRVDEPAKQESSQYYFRVQ
jgi:uncharacterized protein YegP (UPF0339 family)